MKRLAIHIRIDEDTKKMIEAKAKQENRSVSNYLINLALEDIKKDDDLKKTAQ